MAVQNWIKKNNGNADNQNVLSVVRLSQMTCDHLLNFVQPSGLVDELILLQTSAEIQSKFKMSPKDTCKYMLSLYLDFNCEFI